MMCGCADYDVSWGGSAGVEWCGVIGGEKVVKCMCWRLGCVTGGVPIG